MASLAIPYFSSKTELILITLPLNILFAYIPWVVKMIMLCRYKTYDNAHPRLYISSLENDALAGNNAARMILRLNSATLNGIEMVAVWSAAPIATMMFSDVPTWSVTLTALFLSFRIIYYFLYIFIDHRMISYLRTFFFYLAWCCPIMMLFEAAHYIGDRAMNENVLLSTTV